MIKTRITHSQLKIKLQSIANPPIVLISGEVIENVKRQKLYKGNSELITLDYEVERLGFNRRLNIRPAAIVYCTDEKQVAHVINIAKQNPEFPLRAKSTGHDHESESTGTDAIVIDFSLMNDFSLDEKNETATISSGVRFKDIIPILDENNRSIPHGTCETVGVMGFTLGGGWGPWTRLHGMCCERLVGATLIDGNGDIVHLSADNTDQKSKELLWALRGGGGFSFGILIKIVLKTFKQPKFTLRFMVNWKHLLGGVAVPPAMKILRNWENVILPGKNERLIGTNLQINAIPLDDKSLENSIHECVFYGYYGADVESSDELERLLHSDLKLWFADTPASYVDVVTDAKKEEHSFSSWGRVSTLHKKLESEGKTPVLTHFPPDIDDPAPHKLTCRLVDEGGLGQEGRKSLIKSLRSNLISTNGIKAHIHTYVTLGAISGNFYTKEYIKPTFPEGCAFPYSKRPYTVQYQAWWNEEEIDKEEGKKYHVYQYINDAMDWIQESRDAKIPQMHGSFISFKDSSIPTEKYFPGVYDQLRRIKQKYVNDKDNIFRTRKTIM
ncbi:FAD-dependent oxidoreductase [Saprospiraceae bacterium]|nr:FAD-dependent oxidoreductase [Saprospiraceae bacterium]